MASFTLQMRKQRSEDLVTCLESHKLEGEESGLNLGSSGRTILYRTIAYYTIPKHLTTVQGAFTTGICLIFCVNLIGPWGSLEVTVSISAGVSVRVILDQLNV